MNRPLLAYYFLYPHSKNAGFFLPPKGPLEMAKKDGTLHIIVGDKKLLPDMEGLRETTPVTMKNSPAILSARSAVIHVGVDGLPARSFDTANGEKETRAVFMTLKKLLTRAPLLAKKIKKGPTEPLTPFDCTREMVKTKCLHSSSGRTVLRVYFGKNDATL